MSEGEGDRDRLARMARTIGAAAGVDPVADLCDACVEVLGVSGASLAVISHEVPTPVAASDAIAARLESLQLTLGEGPGLDAHRLGRPVREPELSRPLRERWLAFGPAAGATGAGAIFAFPLRLGGVRLGALTLYRATIGDLSHRQHVDAASVADVATTAILATQAEIAAGALGPGGALLSGFTAHLHQASGMVSVQLGVGVGEALVRLRAHAFAADRPLADVADDVITRRLRLEA